MPLEVFIGAIIINRRIAVPALAFLATFLRTEFALGQRDLWFFPLCLPLWIRGLDPAP